MKKALIYCRVSTEEQIGNTSFASQEANCRQLAAEEGYQVARVIREQHSGADLRGRMLLSDARKEIKLGLYDAVIVDKLDRFARKETHQAVVLYEIEEESNAKFLSSEKFDDSVLGRMWRTLIGYFAEFERDRIRERNVQGKKQKAREGKIVGACNALYGYHLNKSTAKREINEAEAVVVRRIYNDVLNGLSVRQIIKKLNAENIPSPAQGKRVWKDGRTRTHWAKAAVTRILTLTEYYGESWAWKYQTSETYAKIRRDPSEHIRLPDDATPPIVTKEIFDEVQAILAKRRENHSYSDNTRNEQRPHLLRGMMFCGCGRKMSPQVSKDTIRYRCGSRHTSAMQACGEKTVRADEAENAVWEKMSEIIRNPQVIEDLLAHKSEDNEGVQLESELESTRKAWQKEKGDYNRQVANLSKLPDFESFLPQIDLQKKKVAGLENEVRQAEARLKKFRESELNADSLREFFDRAAQNLNNFAFEDKRLLLEAFEAKATFRAGELTLTIATPYAELSLGAKPFISRSAGVR